MVSLDADVFHNIFSPLGSAEISQQGEKYVDEQVENAVNGVKAMKDVMKKSSADREKLLHALEKTKEQKEVPCVALCLKKLFLCVIKRRKKNQTITANQSQKRIAIIKQKCMCINSKILFI